MQTINLPSIQNLVSRIHSRINQQEQQTVKKNSRYQSPMHDLDDKQIAQQPVLTWNQIDRSKPHGYHETDNLNRRHNYHFQNQHIHDNYHFQNQHIRQQNQPNQFYFQQQKVRNVAQSHHQTEFHKGPQRKQEGNQMKKLIYEAHYSDKPRHPPVNINYDYQYAQHQKRYYGTSQSKIYHPESQTKSKIHRLVQRDRLSGKKYNKFTAI